MSVTSRILGRVLGLPPVRASRIRVEPDLPIPAGDGVDLLADRYCPVSDARAPLVLIRTTATRLHAAEQELFPDPDHHSAIVLPTVEPVPEP